MVITLTLNPAVDQTLFVERLAVGDVNRAHDSQLDPAGKGINASRMADRLGWPTVAFGFLAGEIGEIAQRALDQEGVQSHFIHVEGQTRLNVSVVEGNGRRSTNVYGPGPAVGEQHLRDMREVLRFWLPASRVLVLAGSLPRGLAADTYAELIEMARGTGVKVILDADDEPYRLGVAARPHLIKPNLAEAERLLGRELPDLAAVAAGAHELSARGIPAVVVSMGKRGAVCVEDGRAWRVTPPPVEVHSTVGSGDSLVAGLAVALAKGQPLVEGLRLGTAAGAATATSEGTALGTAEEVARLLPEVKVEELGGS